MAGRKRALDNALVVKKLIEHKEKLSEKLGKPSDEIWTIISRELDNKISAKALYIFVRRNCSECWKYLAISENNFNSDKLSADEIKTDENEILTVLIVDTAVVNSLIDFDNLKLKAGWCDKLVILLKNNETTVDCTWAFKKHYFGKETYLKIFGRCVECNAALEIVNYDGISGNGSLTLNCKISSVNDDFHIGEKRRKLSGPMRHEVGALLSAGKPSINFLRDEIYGGKKYTDLPKLSCLRKCKQEYKANKLKIEGCKETDPIKKLVEFKWTLPFIHSIKMIAIDKFYMFYWSPEQQQVYNHYCSKSDISILAIDATGSLIRNLQRPYNNTSSHIFLYAAVIHLNHSHGQIPVTQMVSECQDTNTISYWLKNWLKTAKLPKIVVTDHSLALLGAVCWSFNHLLLANYIETIYRYLQGDRTSALPSVMIRVDYAHCIKIVLRWGCFKMKSRRFIEFYVHLMSHIIKSTSFERISGILRSILITANSEFIGCKDGEPIPAQIHREQLKKLICLDADLNLPYNNDEFDDIEENDVNSSLQNWFDRQLEEAMESCHLETDEENFHYCPQINQYLKNFMKTLPLWSGVTVSIYEYGSPSQSSAIVESYFSDLKTRTMKQENLPLRVDNFFLIHYKAIQSMLMLAKSVEEVEHQFGANDNSQEIEDNSVIELEDANEGNISSFRPDENEDEPKVITTEPVFEEHSTLQSADEKLESTELEINQENEGSWIENWGGLGKPKNLKRTRYYGIPTPEIQYIAHGKKIKIPLFKNGNMLNLVHIVNKSKYRVTNTCPFDTLIQCFAAAYCDSENFSVYLNDSKTRCDFFDFICEFLQQGSINRLYKLRCTLIKKSASFHERAMVNGVTIIDVHCNITFIISRMLENFPCTVEKSNCNKCNNSVKIKHIYFMAVYMDRLKQEGFRCLQECIDISPPSHSKCKKCANELIIEKQYSKYLLIDCDVGETTILKEVPLELIIQNNRYFLRGLANFISPMESTGIGHYTSYCRRNDGQWEEYNDLERVFKNIRSDIVVNPHMILYTV